MRLRRLTSHFHRQSESRKSILFRYLSKKISDGLGRIQIVFIFRRARRRRKFMFSFPFNLCWSRTHQAKERLLDSGPFLWPNIWSTKSLNASCYNNKRFDSMFIFDYPRHAKKVAETEDRRRTLTTWFKNHITTRHSEQIYLSATP